MRKYYFSNFTKLSWASFLGFLTQRNAIVCVLINFCTSNHRGYLVQDTDYAVILSSQNIKAQIDTKCLQRDALNKYGE